MSTTPPEWYRNKTLLERALTAHNNSNHAVADAFNVNESTIRKWRTRHHIPARPSSLRVLPVNEPTDDSWLLAALKKHGDNAPVDQLADYGDMSPKRVKEALARLGATGYRIHEHADTRVVLERVAPARENLHQALFTGDHVRVGVVSDTHLGSNEEALAELHLAYDIFEREGITEVWHAGDVGCGVEVFGAKQHSESHVHTLDEQKRYVVREYPKRDGIVTRAVGGNHDLEGLAGRSGWDLVAAVAHERSDIEYLGPFSAWIETRPGTNRWVHLLHGKGGMSYAYSYKAQKLVDSYPSARKPSALVVGHWHVRGNIRARDVEVLWPGCFEWQSQFMSRLGLQPAVGFHILEMTVGDDGSIVRWRPEWFPYYPGRAAVAA